MTRALSDVLEEPLSRKVVLAKLVGAVPLPFWTARGGGHTSYYADLTHRVEGVSSYAFGALMLAASADALDGGGYAFVGGYYWDQAAGRLYVRLPLSFSPFAIPMQALCSWHLANHPRIFDGILYEGRLLEAPEISQRVEDRFGGIGQIGGGTLRLANDGWLAGLEDVEWDGGWVELYLGADV